jgi:hypothetical protein
VGFPVLRGAEHEVSPDANEFFKIREIYGLTTAGVANYDEVQFVCGGGGVEFASQPCIRVIVEFGVRSGVNVVYPGLVDKFL